MDYRQLLTGNPRRSGAIYLAIGVVSLAKAIALRNDKTRFKRELLDAGLFIGVGVLLRRYGTLRDQKRQELESQLPEWLTGEGGGGMEDVRRMAQQRLGGGEPEPKPTLSERAKRMVSSR